MLTLVFEIQDVDLQQLASTYLNKALLKNRQLSSSKYFPESVAKDVDQQSKVPALAGPVANVCARLLNSNPVREAMKEIVASLANILKIETANANDPEDQLEDKARPSKQTKLNPARETVVSSTYDKSEEEDGDSNDNSEDEADDNGVSLFDQDEKGIETSMLKKLASNYLAKGGDVSSDEEEDESDLDDRIVLSSGAEDISDSEGGDDVERPRGRSMSITPIPEDELRAMKQLEEEDFEIVEDDSSDEDMDSDPRVLEKQPKKTKRPKPGPSNPIESHPPPTESIRTSSFLPSLMSGYISGSESEASSLDDDLITSKKQQKEKKNKGPAQKKVRKNRMGQQARRALAEKKFGTGANHIKKEKEAKEAKQKQKEEKRRAWEQKQSQPAHVSWQLKKKEKEEKDRIVKTMMSGNGVGMGKKIVFD